MYQYQPMQLPDFSQAGREMVSGLGALVMMQQARESERRASSEAALGRAERAADREAKLRAQTLEDARLRRQDDRQAFADLMTLRKYERESVVSDLQNIQVLQQMEKRKDQEQLELVHQGDISVAMNAGSPAESALAIGRMASDGVLSGLRPELQQQLLTLQSGQHSTPIPIAGEAAIPLSAIDGMLRSSDEDQKARALAVYFSQNGSEQELGSYGLSPATIAMGKRLAGIAGNHEAAKQAGAIQKQFQNLSQQRALLLGYIQSSIGSTDPAVRGEAEKAKEQLRALKPAMQSLQTLFENLPKTSGMSLDPNTGSIEFDSGVPAAMLVAEGFSDSFRTKGVFTPYEQRLAGLAEDAKAGKLDRDTFMKRAQQLKNELPNPQDFTVSMDHLFVLARAKSEGSLDPYSEDAARVLGNTDWSKGIGQVETAVGGNPVAFISRVLGKDFVEAAANHASYQENRDDFERKGDLPGLTKKAPRVTRDQALQELRSLKALEEFLPADEFSGVQRSRLRFLEDALEMTLDPATGDYLHVSQVSAPGAFPEKWRAFHTEAYRSGITDAIFANPRYEDELLGDAAKEAEVVFRSATVIGSPRLQALSWARGMLQGGAEKDKFFSLMTSSERSTMVGRAEASLLRRGATRGGALFGRPVSYTYTYENLGGMTPAQYKASAWVSRRALDGVSPATTGYKKDELVARIKDLMAEFDRQSKAFSRYGASDIDYSFFVRQDPELRAKVGLLLDHLRRKKGGLEGSPEEAKALNRMLGNSDYGYEGYEGYGTTGPSVFDVLLTPKSPSVSGASGAAGTQAPQTPEAEAPRSRATPAAEKAEGNPLRRASVNFGGE